MNATLIARSLNKGKFRKKIKCLDTGEVAYLTEWADDFFLKGKADKHVAMSAISRAIKRKGTAYGLRFEAVEDQQ